MVQSISQQLRDAIEIISSGGVVAYPTESCIGLGCNPKSYRAIKQILTLKHRSSSKGLIIIGHDLTQLEPYFKSLPDKLLIKLSSSWPGAVTWLVPAAKWVPNWLKGNDDNIAVRVPGHKLARQLCKYCGHALVSTSANRAGKYSCRSVTQLDKMFSNDIGYVIQALCGRSTRPSVIIDLVSGQIVR